MERKPPLLSVKHLTMNFGGIIALDDISFDVQPDEILGIIGPNGSGKTTLFNCLTRIYTPSKGEITFNEQPILKTAPHDVIKLGISRTFQNVALFDNMITLDNVLSGGHILCKTGYISNFLRLPNVIREEKEMLNRAIALLYYFDLIEHISTQAKLLPFVVQKRVEFARALMSNPKILLLDEPASGLNHEETEELIEIIVDIRENFDLSIMLVEHHMNLVMRTSDRVITLDSGKKIAEGLPEEVQKDPAVIEAYLGTTA